MACDHDEFAVHADVVKLAKSDDEPAIIGYTAELRIRCVQCNELFEFMGIPMGMLASEPACNIDGTEARMPIRPLSAPEGFGEDVPGFHVRLGD